jgi:hypothetical protein
MPSCIWGSSRRFRYCEEPTLSFHRRLECRYEVDFPRRSLSSSLLLSFNTIFHLDFPRVLRSVTITHIHIPAITILLHRCVLSVASLGLGLLIITLISLPLLPNRHRRTGCILRPTLRDFQPRWFRYPPAMRLLRRQARWRRQPARRSR